MSDEHTTTDYQPGRDLFVATDHLTHWRGCDAVHPECAYPAVAILLDLVAGLQVAIDDYEPVMHGSARAYLIGLRDRADAYLRQVTGDE